MAAMRWVSIAMLAACGTSSLKDRPDQNIAFATSTVQTGNLGGLAGADAVCTKLAHGAGWDGTYVAWMSSTTTSAFSRVPASVGWVSVDGTPIATSVNDLVTAAILSPIAYDEHGHDVRPGQIETWTGTLADGTTDNNNCADWTSDDPAKIGSVGDSSAGGSVFTNSMGRFCNAPRRLYCLETDRTAPVTVPAPTGRLAFITNAVWAPNAGGIADADAKCQSEAQMAGLSGTYLALLPSPGTTAASRFDTSGPVWMTVGGVALSETAERFFTADYLRGFMNTLPDGSRANVQQAWAGDPVNAQLTTCSGWTMPVNAMTASAGNPRRSSHQLAFSVSATTCDTATLHLYCLQP
jgi:hypothetical protein